MALNIKDQETERLAAEIASMTGDSKTGAIRRALRETKRRLLLARAGRAGDRMVGVLERQVWPGLDEDVRGRAVSRGEEEDILGIGPEGV